MKNIKLLILFVICLFVSCSRSQKNTTTNTTRSTPIVLAYVTLGSQITPDPNYVTHINYAFGYVNETFDGIGIQNEARLLEILRLKNQYPNLKVMLSVGGWTSGRFSEMAGDSICRKSFVANCKRVLSSFNLDGIDLDWEYPTSDVAGISASPNDMDNLLV
ncbi:MAG: hypothetical protein RL662_1048 [Bacteroidota bacterium]|jgi:chitinase